MVRHLTVIVMLFSCSITYAQTDTIHVYFDVKSSELNTVAYQTIDSNIYYDILTKGKKAGVIYYTDNHKHSKRTNELSLTRGEVVVKYLVSMGIPEGDIQLVEHTVELLNSKKNLKDNNPTNTVDIIPGGITITQPENTTEPATIKTLPAISKSVKRESIHLEQVEFQPGTDKLVEESQAALNALYETLNNNPDLRIQIEGHVCCINLYQLPEKPTKKDLAFQQVVNEEAMSLSVKRANTVREYLIKKGIEKKRLQTKGFGNTIPVYEADGVTIKKQKNRRVEIRVLEK